MNEDCGEDVASALTGDRRPWSPQERDVSPLSPAFGLSDGFSCLNEVDLFADLTEAEIQAMDLMAPARMFRRGELVFSQAQPVTALFILKSGRVRVFRVTEDGKALTMAILEPGAVFGEMTLLGQRMYDNYAEAIEDSAICRLDSIDVEHFLLSDPRIAIRISRLLGEQVARLEERLTDLALRPLAARVASTLLSLAETAPAGRFGHGRQIRLTHEQIAGLLGATREATSRILAEMAARGIIRQGRGRISLQNTAALRTMARSTQ
ncbi:Crp/Fnr family transcriptional regulator [Arthrobacter sp. MMS18-M83]|uniref:Crp/Fnr family transcriptional regulator n=1 Tax=Arthrobacter sp. MMS18-M83 TaxID=2996261 RepID=UPI00227A325F|nr:Crp/Fnr family transcriptional regulator [Arthrobacter sp. MMS18-M83]WAH98169.1 Crp/Fnr family transcriptional regulator [Arthrobacter sp. MMS18-M83]